jgi:Arginine methyltransferase oligomerization subdomain
VSDLRGVLPLFQRHISAIADARRRFLAPGGKLVAECDTLAAAVVEAPGLYRRFTTPWADNPYGLNLEPAQQMALHSWILGWVTPEQLLTGTQPWTTLDYYSIEEPNVRKILSWTAARDGTGHGFVVWFDSHLADGVDLSHAPGTPESIYGSGFFPWQQPVSLAAGDSIVVDLQARLTSADYLWVWQTRIESPSGQVKASFQQATFFSHPFSGRKHSASFVPRINQEGQITRVALELMGEGLSQGNIARRLADGFPAAFSDWEDALSYVASLAEQYASP